MTEMVETCPKGHELTPENTYTRGTGVKGCRTCSAGRRPDNPVREYSPELIEQALQLRAVLGNSRETARRMIAEGWTKLDGSTPKEETLASMVGTWCRSHPTYRDRYLQIREELAPRMHEQIAAQTEDLALEYAEAEREALERARATMGDLEGKDAAIALKNLAVGKSANIDKGLVIRGKPTQITEHHRPDELYEELKALGIKVNISAPETVDGTAEEVEDAQVEGGS